MAETSRTTATQPAVQGVLSKSAAHSFTVQGQSSLARIGAMSLVVGAAASVPATFADFTTGKHVTFTPSAAVSLSFSVAPSGVMSFNETVQDNLASGLVVGTDQVYVAVFSVLAPSGADPVLSVSGPFNVDD